MSTQQVCLGLFEVQQEVPDRSRGASGVSVQPSIRGDKTLPLPPFDALKAFLVEYYLYSRFQGRDGPIWGANYSDVVTASSMKALQERGLTCVSMYDSNRGRVIWFDRSLTVLNPDEAPAQIQRKAGNLTHIYGAAF